MKEYLTPKKIVEELDKYIISQDEAKKNVAISLRNRYRRKAIEDKDLRSEITPKNIILIGPTGVGKTEIARRLAKITNAPFLKVEATKYTEVGYVGKDVESMIKDLLSVSIMELKQEKIKELEEKYYEITVEKLAKLINPLDTLNDEIKERVIEEIKSGRLDGEIVEIDKKTQKGLSNSMIEVIAPDNGDINEAIESIVSNLSNNNQKKKIKMSVKDAIKYLLDEEINDAIDMDEIIPEAIKKVENDGIIFIDEIDKIAEREGNSRGEVSRQGVQRDILPIVEGTTVMTKYGAIKTDHILFIAAGAFTLSSPSDLMPELQGRFPIKIKLKSLEKEDFIKILTEIEYNLLRQYKELLKIDNVDLSFSKGAIEAIAEVSLELNENVENIGARRLASVIEAVLREIMFEAPYEEKITVKIDKKLVDKIFKVEFEEENLDKYIL
ncbi:ATP-dependent protease ATPase subunit HslU [Cetobacterium sp. SF1]|uniref:ATP-dependent protease ATPase subunit HslU n=1 Tax=unclassified Cetobacterium TaxID=2630983 RepID=UPI003CECB989